MQFNSYILLLLSAILVNNVVLSRILGLCPFLGVSKKLSVSVGMGLATTFVLTLASATSYLINIALMALELEYLRTLAFIILIAAIVQFTEIFIRKSSPMLYQSLGIYLPLITTNCAVLGVPLLNTAQHHNFVESLLFGFGSALGFFLVLILFSCLRERLEGAQVPVTWRGTAIAFVTAGLMSLAFMGFGGIIV